MLPTDDSDSDSRRSFLKRSALATALGLTASGATAAQEGDDGEDGGAGEGGGAGEDGAGDEDGGNGEEGVGDDDDGVEINEQFSVVVFDHHFRGSARFFLSSGVIEWKPTIPADLGSRLTEYDTYMATYLNTAERFPIFVSQQAQLEADYDEEKGYFVDPDQVFTRDEFAHPQVYELADPYRRFQGTDKMITGVAWPLEEDVENDVFDDEGLDTEEEFDDFRF